MLVIIALTSAYSVVRPQPTGAQTPPDTCALLQAEADAILAKAAQATTDEAKVLKDRAALFSNPCTETVSETDLVELWGYDAATKDDLRRWMQYGLYPETWDTVGLGTGAAFKLTIPEAPAKKYNGVLSIRGVDVNNALTYPYEGEFYPVYIVPSDGTFLVLPLIKKGRQSSRFFDPVSGEVIEWAGNWRRLAPVITPNIAVEFSFRVRLDTADSFVRAYIGTFAVYNDQQLSVKVMPDSVVIQTPTEKTTVAGAFKVGDWYTFRLLATSNQLRVYLDDKQIGEMKLDTFVFEQAAPGFFTSAKPATVSFDDIHAKSNHPSK